MTVAETGSGANLAVVSAQANEVALLSIDESGVLLPVSTFEPPDGAPVSSANNVAFDAAGKTVLPGLIDMHAHLLSGGFDTITDKSMSYDPTEQMRALRQMLYWGVTSVYSPVQPLEQGLELRSAAARDSRARPATACACARRRPSSSPAR